MRYHKESITHPEPTYLKVKLNFFCVLTGFNVLCEFVRFEPTKNTQRNFKYKYGALEV